MDKQYIRQHMLTASIFIFMILFGVIQYAKPSVFYNTDGSIRKFGVGYKNKTILPIWLFAIVLAILTYVGILYYLEYF
jgi:hypothetical protein